MIISCTNTTQAKHTNSKLGEGTRVAIHLPASRIMERGEARRDRIAT